MFRHGTINLRKNVQAARFSQQFFLFVNLLICLSNLIQIQLAITFASDKMNIYLSEVNLLTKNSQVGLDSCVSSIIAIPLHFQLQTGVSSDFT